MLQKNLLSVKIEHLNHCEVINITTLSDTIQYLEEVLKLLKIAESSSFESVTWHTSSLQPLLGVLTGLLMKTSSLMKEDFRAFPSPTPGILFLEWMQDELGNPKQIRIAKKPPILGPDIFTANLLSLIAEYLVNLKIGLQVSLHGNLWEPSVLSGQLHVLKVLRSNFFKVIDKESSKIKKMKQSMHSKFIRMQRNK